MTAVNHLDALNELVYQDHKTVTYRYLSRHLDVPVNIAKQMLYDFVQQTPTKTISSVKAHATYCIAGYRNVACNSMGVENGENGENGENVRPELVHTVIVVPEELCEARKCQFAKLTSVHVYSVAISRPKDSMFLVPANIDLPNSGLDNESERYGLIKNDAIQVTETKSRPQAQVASKPGPLVTSKSAPPLITAKSSTPGPSSASVISKKSSSGSITKGSKKPVANKKATASFFGNPRLKKPVSPTKKPEEAEKVVIPEVAGSDDDEDDIDEEERDRRLAVASASAAADSEDVEMDNLDTENESNDNTEDSAADAKLQAQQRAILIAEMEMMDRDDALAEKNRTVEEKSLEAEKMAPSTKRGRRKVTKQKTSKNARGYMVTEDVVEWESFSEDDDFMPEPRRKQKPNPKPVEVEITSPKQSPTKQKAVGKKATESTSVAGRKKKGSGGQQSGGQQSNLLSFWKK